MSDTNLWTHHQWSNRNHLKEGYYRQNMLLKTVKKHIPAGGTILEIGFWDGYLLSQLALWWYTALWQDISAENIEITKNQWPTSKIQFLLGGEDGKLLVESDSIDGFIASEVLEHFSDSELEEIVPEIYRVLKPGGCAIITFPYHENLEKSTHFCPNCSTVFHTWWHKQSWNRDTVNRVFAIFKEISLTRFISLGQLHAKNIFIRILAYILDTLFLVKQDIFEWVTSNYLVVVKKELH